MSPAQQEVRVGAFILFAVAVAVGFVLLLGRVSLGRGTPLCVDYAYIGALQVGAPVKVSGVSVGRVRGIDLLTPSSAPPAAKPSEGLGRNDVPRVRVCMTLDTAALQLVNDGAVFAVATQGVIGEAYLELEPHTGAALSIGAALRGADAPRLHVMTLQAEALMNVAGSMLQTSHASQAPSDVGRAVVSLLGTIDGILSERRPVIVSALDDVAAITADLRHVAAGLKGGVGDGETLRALVDQARSAVSMVQRELPPVAQRTSDALTSLRALSDKTNAALDPNTVDVVVRDTRAAAAHMEQLTADAQKVMQEVRRGEGTLGGFVQDPQIYDDVKELLRDLKQHPWKVLWRN